MNTVLQHLYLRFRGTAPVLKRVVKGVLDKEAHIMLQRTLAKNCDFYYFEGTFEPTGRTPRRLRQPNVEV